MSKIHDDTTDFVPGEENDVEVKKADQESRKGKVKSEESIDDPVRMYLMQMGRIPLLSRVGGNRRCQENRPRPTAVSQFHVGDRFHASGSVRSSAKGSKRRIATGSYH